MLLNCGVEKTLESPLDCKEIQPVHPKGSQSWILTERTDSVAETPILWPPDAKSWLIGKDPDAGEDWRQEDKRMTDDKMVAWHHQLNGREFEQAPGDGEGQGSMANRRPWDHKGLDTNEWPNRNNKAEFHCYLLLSYCRVRFIILEDPPGGSAVKSLPAVQETQETKVWSLGQKGSLE